MWDTIGIWVEAVALILIFGLELREYRRQGRDRNEDQKEKLQQMRLMREQARATKASADALINSERAWIDGELVRNQDLGVRRYSLRIRNFGKTPAQIRSFQVSTGPIREDGTFSPDNLPTEKTTNLHIFIGSGAVESLEEQINMDDIYPTDDSMGMGKGPYRVAIKYTDVVTGAPEDRIERETSFVYLYTPFLQSVQRLSVFNKYS